MARQNTRGWILKFVVMAMALRTMGSGELTIASNEGAMGMDDCLKGAGPNRSLHIVMKTSLKPGAASSADALEPLRPPLKMPPARGDRKRYQHF